MTHKITYNNADFVPSESDFPMLIHGQEGSGASFFSINVVASLYQSGYKLLCLTGFKMARNEFCQQVGIQPKDVVLPQPATLLFAIAQQAIFFTKENTSLFLDLFKNLDDVNERIILVKNIELFGQDVVEKILTKNHVIISGDIDKSESPTSLLNREYNSKVLFSYSNQIADPVLPELPKYHGYMKNKSSEGIINLNAK